MESRKMVLKNLFTGQQWRNRHREQSYGHEERVGKVTWKLTFSHVKQRANGNLLYDSGAQYQSRGMGWDRSWEGGSKSRGYMYALEYDIYLSLSDSLHSV